MEKDDPGMAWPALVRAYQNIRAEAEAALRCHGLSSLDEYDVLLELRRAIEPLSMSELEAGTLLRQYQTSRLVDRLAVKGLVQRTASKDDGRSRLATLTPHGRAVQRAAGRTYALVLDKRFSERLDSSEGKVLRQLLVRVAAD